LQKLNRIGVEKCAKCDVAMKEILTEKEMKIGAAEGEKMMRHDSMII
jgi:bacterioferritin-associated ferredoxin